MKEKRTKTTDGEKLTITPSELRAILGEYEYHEDIFTEESTRTIKIKRALGKLPMPERIIFCLYMDLGASRKVGAVLGVSHSTILKEINRIKEKIRYQMMIDNYDDDIYEPISD